MEEQLNEEGGGEMSEEEYEMLRQGDSVKVLLSGPVIVLIFECRGSKEGVR